MSGAREPPRTRPGWPGWPIATAICARFYSRLPIPALRSESLNDRAPDFALVARALPVAALVIALPSALALFGLGAAGVSALFTAAVAIIALTMTTGALHEDGLADCADGLFGGHTRERRLEIMKDSRIGSFGALALMSSLILRISALAAILQTAGALAASGAVLIAACLSRTATIFLLAAMRPARPNGTAAAVGRPTLATIAIALGLTLAIALVGVVMTRLPLTGLILGGALAIVAVGWLARLSRRLIGGQTGDVLGAAQQLSEIAVLSGFAVAVI